MSTLHFYLRVLLWFAVLLLLFTGNDHHIKSLSSKVETTNETKRNDTLLINKHDSISVYPPNMTMLLVGAVEQYGATQEGPLVVPLASTAHEKTHSTTPIPVRKTQKLLFAGIIGMTAAVASSALVFFSIVDFSKQQARTEPSFLLHDRGGADDNNCVVASGPFPGFSDEQNDPRRQHLQDNPYVNCFSAKNPNVYDPGDYCWSHSAYDSPYWVPCTPLGFGGVDAVWVYAVYFNTANPGCGTPCTEFSD